ncbi:MAG: YmdB family metallophosphoesterase [Candidatus Komeilibacteria bacterium]|nr:YmdB family metallophosphoesterase [Candidatus Komeilibacteria bacterium]
MPVKHLKIIFFGDIMGKIGRQAVAQILPHWQAEYQPDLIMANVENIAHGKGVTAKTLSEMKDLGIQVMTSGNHVWRKDNVTNLIDQEGYPLLTPANDPRSRTGDGTKIITVKDTKVAIINLLAYEAMKAYADNGDEMTIQSPFEAIDEILAEDSVKSSTVKIIDFHSEMTSEARAMGWYVDGRVSAVLGTHTHIPTADAQIMPAGTAYITDVGMVGGYETVLGVKKDIILDRFIAGKKIVFDIPKSGPAEINAVYMEIEASTGKPQLFRHLREIVEIK